MPTDSKEISAPPAQSIPIPDNTSRQGQIPEAPSTYPPTSNQPVTNQPIPQYNIQPINGGYTIQGIQIPYNSQQPMFNDSMVLNVLPPQNYNPIAIVNPTVPPPTVCTSTRPQLFYCTNCKKVQISRVTVKTDYLKIFLFILLFLVLLVFLFFVFICIPFSFKKVVHTCPQCGKQVGVVKV